MESHGARTTMPASSDPPRAAEPRLYHPHVLALRDVHFEYPGRPVLRAVSAEFPRAAVTAVIGPNGAGKSTLLRLLLGLLAPSRGTVLKDSKPLASLPPRERARTLAYVPQHSQVAFPFTAREVVRLGRYNAGGGDDGVDEALARVDIADRARDLFGHLSAGQQQRVTLARALTQLEGGGHYLLADEPVSAMDPSHALRAMGVLTSLAAAGLGVVVVLHDLSLVLRYASRVVVLAPDGTPAAEGPVGEVLAPGLLERVYGVPFRPLLDQDGRTLGLVPVEPG